MIRATDYGLGSRSKFIVDSLWLKITGNCLLFTDDCLLPQEFSGGGVGSQSGC